MNIQEALSFTEIKIKNGAISDGCTYAPDLGIKKWCVMHDMLRRFKPVSALEADNLFFKGIMTKGFRYIPIAAIYWLAVRYFSLFKDKTAPAVSFLILITTIGLLAYFTN